MRLKRIKLAGFKSFVDPTPIPIASSLVGIVGPNGCGKSNVIDAVRWVMGESAAGRLRGELMTDVIFSGSSHRAPVDQAYVELLFDNEQTTLTGEFAEYSDISIAREVSRDGQSEYYVNGKRCRRRDISDLFLGTGLGPRSYSIIQQGTVARLIEAKPEELRQYLEEAAGISKYKERRKETSQRIVHTRENLDRLNDVRLELEKQLAHLQRQAAAAARYRELKQEERDTQALLHAMKWRILHEQIQEKSRYLQEQDVVVETNILRVDALEAEIDKTKLQLSHAQEAFNQTQVTYYRVGNEVNRVEQSIQHHQEREQQLKQDIHALDSHEKELQQTLTQDTQEQIYLEHHVAELAPAHEIAQEVADTTQQQLVEAEQAVHMWRTAWDEFTVQASASSKTAEVEQAKIRQLEERLMSLKNKMERVARETAELHIEPFEQAASELQEQILLVTVRVEESSQAFLDGKQAIEEQRLHMHEVSTALDREKQQLQQSLGQQASLIALQEAALSYKNTHAKQWIQQQGLEKAQRLAQIVHVEQGWEQAVEVVLGDYLQAVCVHDAISNYTAAVASMTGGQLMLISPHPSTIATAPHSLLSKVSSDYGLAELVHVLTADSLEAAIAAQSQLKAYESIVTREGIWLGPNWVRVAMDKDPSSGIIERERVLTALTLKIEQQQEQLEQTQQRLVQAQEIVHALQQKQEALQEQQQYHARHLSRLEADYRVKQHQLEQVKHRQQRLLAEQQEYQTDYASLSEILLGSRDVWQEALAQMSEHQASREHLSEEKEITYRRLDMARQEANVSKQKAHQLAVNLQTAKTQLASLTHTVQRSQQQVQKLMERRQHAEQALAQAIEPVQTLLISLDTLLDQRVSSEQAMNQAREAVGRISEQATHLDHEKQVLDKALTEKRHQLQTERVAVEGLRVRQQTISEQLSAMELTVESQLEHLTADHSVAVLEETLGHIERRIQRLGPINLAAINECKETEERKVYLDAQHKDLEEALAMLVDAMDKIDKETKTKFKETYDRVNESFKALFPKIFGGGSASLELTGQDLLDTGVEVFARPPGKKNSTIHLLSGGEKTMTAIALVFSIFQLNPAPFCMLDEVDAPLDDANVVRFCELVKVMALKVQFIVITHNKVTMEMMNQLMGVTMHEPGVSRIVSVDVQQAANLAEG